MHPSIDRPPERPLGVKVAVWADGIAMAAFVVGSMFIHPFNVLWAAPLMLVPALVPLNCWEMSRPGLWTRCVLAAIVSGICALGLLRWAVGATGSLTLPQAGLAAGLCLWNVVAGAGCGRGLWEFRIVRRERARKARRIRPIAVGKQERELSHPGRREAPPRPLSLTILLVSDFLVLGLSFLWFVFAGPGSRQAVILLWLMHLPALFVSVAAWRMSRPAVVGRLAIGLAALVLAVGVDLLSAWALVALLDGLLAAYAGFKTLRLFDEHARDVAEFAASRPRRQARLPDPAGGSMEP